ncbi:unnamed protein product [Camellia sinensis]
MDDFQTLKTRLCIIGSGPAAHTAAIYAARAELKPVLFKGWMANNIAPGGQEFRMMLAWKAFQHSGLYDCAVSEWLWKQPTVGGEYPLSFAVPLSLKSSLRYGENPHQTAAVYVDKRLSEVNAGGIASAIQHHGKEMSFNNYLDADAAWNCVRDFNNPTCVIVKHTNPCGVASRDDIIEAYRLAVKADP